MSANLTSDEQSAIAAIEARFSERARRPITLGKLLALWGNFVTEVERGYESTIDEYTNDLSTRDLIDEALHQVPSALNGKLQPEVEPLDKRFEQATRPDDGNRIGQFIKPGEGWWWSRLPTRLGALANDLGTG
jgi:hypothetical protein